MKRTEIDKILLSSLHIFHLTHNLESFGQNKKILRINIGKSRLWKKQISFYADPKRRILKKNEPI